MYKFSDCQTNVVLLDRLYCISKPDNVLYDYFVHYSYCKCEFKQIKLQYNILQRKLVINYHRLAFNIFKWPKISHDLYNGLYSHLPV